AGARIPGEQVPVAPRRPVRAAPGCGRVTAGAASGAARIECRAGVRVATGRAVRDGPVAALEGGDGRNAGDPCGRQIEVRQRSVAGGGARVRRGPAGSLVEAPSAGEVPREGDLAVHARLD